MMEFAKSKAMQQDVRLGRLTGVGSIDVFAASPALDEMLDDLLDRKFVSGAPA